MDPRKVVRNTAVITVCVAIPLVTLLGVIRLAVNMGFCIQTVF